MTVENFIIKERRRLQDLRTSTGTIITIGSQDGLRWSANDMLDLLNDMLEMVARLLMTYPSSPLIKQLLENNIVVKKELSFADGEYIEDLGNDVLGLVGLEDKNVSRKEYAYISPSQYRLYENSDNPAVKNSFWYTLLRDGDNEYVKQLWILPKATGTLVLEGSLLVQPDKYTSSDLAKELYFHGIDDLLIDAGEMMARLNEGYHEQAKFIFEIIKFKMGVTGNA